MAIRNSAPLLKRCVAGTLDGLGLLHGDLRSRGGRFVLAVNYHGTPQGLAENLGRHFRYYADHFECLSEEDLLGFLAGRRPAFRPGIVLCFDDGLRNNADVAARLLEESGLRGWFMLPGGFLDEPAAEQARYFGKNIRQEPTVEHPDEREAVAMTWEMARSLALRGHAIGCHTWSHCPMGEGTSAETIVEEVDRAKERLEARLGSKVCSFAWVRGRPTDYSANAHRAVASRFAIAFTSMSRAIRVGDTPTALHRFNVEASFPLSVVRFQVSRLNELAFARRRRFVEATVRGIA